jgi:tRNA U34 5-methylaminomethyl-2-thiouridine-forming methyltransferase MnmC
MTEDEFEVRETGDGSLTLFHPGYGETYHSRHGALNEARHVFLHESGVLERLSEGKTTRILEIGFGLGLNFFLTAATALKHGVSIDYVSLEQHLLPVEYFSQIDYARLTGVDEMGEQFRNWRVELGNLEEGAYTLDFQNRIRLTLIIGNALNANPEGLYDAIYQDAFSPDQNPELWSTQFLQSLADRLQVGGCLTTYSAKGDVRRSLQATGLTVFKRPGPPRKKEMLKAIKELG